MRRHSDHRLEGEVDPGHIEVVQVVVLDLAVRLVRQDMVLVPRRRTLALSGLYHLRGRNKIDERSLHPDMATAGKTAGPAVAGDMVDTGQGLELAVVPVVSIEVRSQGLANAEVENMVAGTYCPVVGIEVADAVAVAGLAIAAADMVAGATRLV